MRGEEFNIKGIAQLVRAAGLLAVIGGPHRFGRALARIIRDGAVGVFDINGGEQVGEEEARLDERDLDAELPHLSLHRKRQAFDRELRRAIGAAMLQAHNTGDGADVDDMA